MSDREWFARLYEAATKVVADHSPVIANPVHVPAKELRELKRVVEEYAKTPLPPPPPSDWRGIVHDAVLEGRLDDAINIIRLESIRIDIPANMECQWVQMSPGWHLKVAHKSLETLLDESNKRMGLKASVEWVYCDQCSTQHAAPACTRF